MAVERGHPGGQMEGLLEIKRAESRDLQLLLAAAASWLRSGLRLSGALSALRIRRRHLQLAGMNAGWQ